MYSNNDIVRFFKLFAANTAAYGKTVLTGNIVDGKAESSSSLVKEELSPAVISQHLSGKVSIGAAPLCQDGLCRFGALDIDSYDYNLLDVVNAIYDFGMPLFPCWSKSKKLHLYIFFQEGATPDQVKEILSQYRDIFFCDKKTEIFPKQMSLTSTNKFYSWINLPYFDANDESNYRKLATKEGLELSLPKALDYAESICIPYGEHKLFLDNMPYHDAPPCIRTGLYLRDIGKGKRNNFLFSVGAYLRLKDENADIDSLLCDINASMHDPLPEHELKETIIKSFNKKTYFYMCATMDRCNKGLCRQGDYGIESKQSTGLDFGDMTQIMTDPPYYEWIVSGQKLTFWTEMEVLQQTKFRALCMRQLHLVPRKIKDDVWSKILTRALSNITVIVPTEETGDFSPGSMFKELVYNFFNTRRLAANEHQVKMGRIYKDNENGVFIFTAKSLMDFILLKNDFRYFSSVEIQTRMENMGSKRKGLYWTLPISAIPQQESKDEEEAQHEEF